MVVFSVVHGALLALGRRGNAPRAGSRPGCRRADGRPDALEAVPNGSRGRCDARGRGQQLGEDCTAGRGQARRDERQGPPSRCGWRALCRTCRRRGRASSRCIIGCCSLLGLADVLDGVCARAARLLGCGGALVFWRERVDEVASADEDDGSEDKEVGGACSWREAGGCWSGGRSGRGSGDGGGEARAVLSDVRGNGRRRLRWRQWRCCALVRVGYVSCLARRGRRCIRARAHSGVLLAGAARLLLLVLHARRWGAHKAAAQTLCTALELRTLGRGRASARRRSTRRAGRAAREGEGGEREGASGRSAMCAQLRVRTG